MNWLTMLNFLSAFCIFLIVFHFGFHDFFFTYFSMVGSFIVSSIPPKQNLWDSESSESSESSKSVSSYGFPLHHIPLLVYSTLFQSGKNSSNCLSYTSTSLPPILTRVYPYPSYIPFTYRIPFFVSRATIQFVVQSNCSCSPHSSHTKLNIPIFASQSFSRDRSPFFLLCGIL